MAWVHVVPEDAAQGEVRAAYDRIRARRGAVGNVVKVSSLLPEVMERGIDFYVALMFGAHALSRPQREMVAVEVSRTNACDYCVHHHGAALERVTRDAEFTHAMMHAGHHPNLTPPDRAMLAYVRKLTLRPGQVGREDVEALRQAGFGDEAIVAINHVAAYFNMMNRIASGLGVDLEPDKGADPRYKY